MAGEGGEEWGRGRAGGREERRGGGFMGGEGGTYWNGQTHWGAKLQLQLCVIRFITNCLGCYACGRAQPLCLDGLDKRLCLMLKKTRAEVLPRIE